MSIREQLPRANLLRQRRRGRVEVFISRAERDMLLHDPEFQALPDQWPKERLAQAPVNLKLTATRFCHLLGISEVAWGYLLKGEKLPSPSLCRRIEQLYDMEARGELHRCYVPKNPLDLQRFMCLYRHWWFNDRDPSVDLPILTIHVELRWGNAPYQKVKLPMKFAPKMRLNTWGALFDFVKAFKYFLGGFARKNNAEMWKEAEKQFWFEYAHGTIPKEVEKRNKMYQCSLESRRIRRDSKRQQKAAEERMKASGE